MSSTVLTPTGSSTRIVKPRRVGLDLPTKVMIVLVVVLLTIMIGVPVVRVLALSFSEAGRVELARMTRGSSLQILGHTVLLGTLVGLIGSGLGFLLAYVQVRCTFFGKRFLHLIALLPIVSPPFAVATAVITLFGRRGLITYRVLGLQDFTIYGLPGLTLVLSVSFFPVAYMNFKGLLEHLDPALDEAAQSLGAARWTVFRTVTLPMMIPGIASSFLLLFVETIADLANPLAIGGDYTVLASKAYMAITGDYNLGGGAAYCLVLLVPALLVFIIQRYWVSKKEVVSVTGKPAGKPQQMVDGPGYWVLLVAAWLVVAFTILIYGTVVVGAFMQSIGINNTWTLTNFVWAMEGNGGQAMITTTLLALIATPIAGIFGMIIAWLVVRKLRVAQGALDFIGMLGLAVPGTVVGIGYMLAFNMPLIVGNYQFFPALTGGNAVFAGALGIIMVFIVRSMPTGQRAGVAALQQIDPAIDEASTSLGASGTTTFRKITLPIIRPAFLSGLTNSFARSMTTLSPIIFIVTPRTRILTAEIFSEVNAGRFGHAFAYCTILLVIVMAVIGVFNLVVRDSGASPISQAGA